MLGSHLPVMVASCAAMALLLAAVYGWSKWRGASDLLPSGQRDVTLDGLRAFLALGVCFAHAWGFHDHYFCGTWWGRPANPYLFHAANLSVPLFFMITAYLYWSRAIRSGGRLHPGRLYRNRLRRILPLYYFVCGGAVAIALADPARTGGISAGTAEAELASLVVPGLRNMGPLFGTERLFLLGQASTLLYELGFYLVLPLIGFAAASRRAATIFIVMGLAGLLAHERAFGGASYPLYSFAAGIITAELLAHVPAIAAPLQSRVVSFALLLLLPLLPVVSDGELTGVAFLATAGAFLAIAGGNRLFGLLTLRPARMLGTISYSIYLVHMLVLYPLLNGLNRLTPVGRLEPGWFVIVVFFAAVLVVAVSMLTYRLIERPWLERPVKPSA